MWRIAIRPLRIRFAPAQHTCAGRNGARVAGLAGLWTALTFTAALAQPAAQPAYDTSIPTHGIVKASSPAQDIATGSIAAHGIAMHGAPDLAPGFSHFPYARPDAPKGGQLSLGQFGTFDSLNPFNLKAGSAAHGLVGPVYQTLMMRSSDEAFTLYGLIAESIETNASRDYVQFRLNPAARFSDGKPVTSADVKFSFDLLGKKGRPQHRAAFALVKAMETPDARTVRFDLAGANDRELPLILALMPVLPAHAIDVEGFENASLKAPVGSGPYKVKEIQPGRMIVFERIKDYWARDLGSQRGLFNFDTIKIEYFRDATAFHEALKGGLIDYREETDPTRWLNAYHFPAVADGRVIRRSLPLGGAKGMLGFAFNTRRPIFQDVRVREALAIMFDFEWINTKLYGGLFERTKSFFDHTDLASAGRPASEAERKLLARWPGVVREDIMSGAWTPPVSDGTGRDRKLARKALDLLQAAGWSIRNGQLRHSKTGAPFSFEMMVTERDQERLALIYADWLRRIGIEMRVRQVDLVQYQRRRQSFDFDMMPGAWIASSSPGNEQRNRWSSAAADIPSSFNLAGVKSPVVDTLIATILASVAKEDFVTAVRAYDRVLLAGFYIVPLFHKPQQWFTHRAELQFPARLPKYGSPLFGSLLDTWWRQKP